VCPKVLFTGRPIDFKKEFGLAFDDYMEAYEGTTNMMIYRGTACIALCPTNNAASSWILWKISTRSIIRHSNWVKLVTSQLIIDAMNAILQEGAERAEGTIKELQDVIMM